MMKADQVKPVPVPVQLTVYFDGGCEPNPGQGYGSYEIVSSVAEFNFKRERQKFGHMTNNMAEWNALLCALESLPMAEAGRIELEIFTDSMLVCQQLQGNWKCKQWYLRELRDQCMNLLRHFALWTIQWHSRENNVARFGH